MGIYRLVLKAAVVISVFCIFLQGGDYFSLRTAPLYAQQEVPALPQPQPNNLFAPVPVTQPNAPVGQPSQPQPVQQSAQPQPRFVPQPQIQAVPQLPQPPQPQSGGLPGFAAPASKRGEISFNFDDADVYSVIQTIFGDVLKVNYIVDPNVKGRVTFRSVAPVARDEVLPLMEVILRLNGIGVVEEGGLYRIVPIADISKEPAPAGVGRESAMVQVNGKALVQVVPIKYTQSSEMVRVLTPFLSKNAVIIDVPKSNYIIISDTDANVRRLLQLVEIFDSEALKQVTPQVFVYPVQNGKAKDVASLLQQIFLGAKGSAGKPAATTTKAPTTPGQPAQPVIPQQSQVSAAQAGGEALISETTRIIGDDVTNAIIILATPDDYALIYATLQKIDVAPRQVMIEGLIVEVTISDNYAYGMSWTLGTNINISGLKPFTKPINLTGTAGNETGSLAPANLPSSGFTFVGVDPTGNIRAVLSALEGTSKTKVLAAPHILVSDNREARIQVGQQIPIATSTTSQPLSSTTTGTVTATASYATSTIQYKDIGIILKVKPQVNDSGLISLEINQEISALGDTVVVAGLGELSINKTEASSFLVAQDGETIVIGGLIREDTSKGTSGIPLLSRIPLLGGLFGNVSDKKSKNEIIILLTPRVVRNRQEAVSATTDYVNRYKGVTRDKEIEDFIMERGQKRQGTEEKPDKNGGNGN